VQYTRECRFQEAATVLDDEAALTREDPDSIEEQRFVTLGLSGLAISWLSSMRTASRILCGSFPLEGKQRQRRQYEKVVAEPYLRFRFSRAKRGAVAPPEAGKTKISIRSIKPRLDTSVLR